MIQKAKISDIKVRAFTMIDMITGMVIMSIIITLVFYIFSGFNQQIHSYANAKSDIISLNLLKCELEQAVFNSDKIVEKPNGFSLISEKPEVAYLLKGTELLKQMNLNIEPVYDEVKTIEIESFNNSGSFQEEELISGISLRVSIKEKDLNLYLYKQYSNQEQINFSILNEIK